MAGRLTAVPPPTTTKSYCDVSRSLGVVKILTEIDGTVSNKAIKMKAKTDIMVVYLSG